MNKKRYRIYCFDCMEENILELTNEEAHNTKCPRCGSKQAVVKQNSFD